MSSSDDSSSMALPREGEPSIAVEVPQDMKPVAAFRQYRSDPEEAREEGESACHEDITALAQQAVLATQLEMALGRYEADFSGASLTRMHRHLRVVKDMMLDALREAGLTIVNPSGRPYGEIADLVHIVGWRHLPDFTSEVVAEVLEPIVCYRGEVVRFGRVVMGAPAQQAINEVPHDSGPLEGLE